MKTENKIHDVFILYNQKNSQFWWWGNSMEAKFISHHKANDDFFVTYWNPVLQKDNSPSKDAHGPKVSKHWAYLGDILVLIENPLSFNKFKFRIEN